MRRSWRAFSRASASRRDTSTTKSFASSRKCIAARPVRRALPARKRGWPPSLRGAARRYSLARIELAASGGEDPTVGEFLQMLEPELRAIFILFELEAEASESIAAAFGLTVEAV